mmetsp:Transcript_6360/g.16518  ORF Transcript_6360/g.16518 Transcript_6360/m.16518 type:complete len:86 (-) Transcript_6360:162-419(-)
MPRFGDMVVAHLNCASGSRGSAESLSRDCDEDEDDDEVLSLSSAAGNAALDEDEEEEEERRRRRMTHQTNLRDGTNHTHHPLNSP